MQIIENVNVQLLVFMGIGVVIMIVWVLREPHVRELVDDDGKADIELR